MERNESESIRVGTRGSLLATTQTNRIIQSLLNNYPDHKFEVITIRTTGDMHIDGPLSPSLGKGYFTREIENALLAGDIDFAVHSLKDLPTELPQGLKLGAITEREDPRDALIGMAIADIGSGDVRIGTSSLRRASQLRAMYKGCNVVDLRGNLDTRLRKVEEGVVDCAVMAAAGLNRLDRSDRITELFEMDIMLPAPGQGALAIEMRENDLRIGSVLKSICCMVTESCVKAERAFMQRLGGGCQVPVAAMGVIENDILVLKGKVVSLDGTCVFYGEKSGKPDDCEEIGIELAEDLISQGAEEVLKQVENHLSGLNLP